MNAERKVGKEERERGRRKEAIIRWREGDGGGRGRRERCMAMRGRLLFAVPEKC